MFTNFVNFYRRSIKNFNKIIALLTLILQIINKVTEASFPYTKANNDKQNKEVRDVLKLVSLIRMMKLLSDLTKGKRLKDSFSETDFLIFGAKKHL